jgi:hypothetical protein
MGLAHWVLGHFSMGYKCCAWVLHAGVFLFLFKIYLTDCTWGLHANVLEEAGWRLFS